MSTDQPAPATPNGIAITAVPSGTGEAFPPPPYGAALLPDDPPMIGGFWLDGRLAARPSAVTYLAHDDATSENVMLIVLTEGAAGDAAARDRLAGEVNRMHADTVVARGGAGQGDGRLASKFRADKDEPIPTDDTPVAPWVALAYDHSVDAIAEADRLMRCVDLSSTPPLGTASGPGFRLPWVTRTKPGNWRRWPLPWPGRTDRASWVSVLVAWLLMLAIGALALLIVVLLFQNPPPPGGGGGGGGGQTSSSESSESSESGSQSQSASQSQSSESGSQSQSEQSGTQEWGSPTKSQSMFSPNGSSGSMGTTTRDENL